MGAPSHEQVEEAIAAGLARGDSEEAILGEVSKLERMSDEELVAIGVVPSAPEPAPPAPPQAAPPPAGDPLDFAPAPVRHRHDGWTAERQRAFIAALAETGCVSEACAEVGITPRSAYRLREHASAAAFRTAWDHAQALSTVRLTALAFERAIHGRVERYYKDGELVGERRVPSDRLLMWLLAHHDPATYGWASKPPATAPDMSFFPVVNARLEIARQIEGIADVDPDSCPADPLSIRDFDLQEDVPPA